MAGKKSVATSMPKTESKKSLDEQLHNMVQNCDTADEKEINNISHLVRCGADVNFCPKNYERTSLECAIYARRRELLPYLLQKKTDTNIAKKNDLETLEVPVSDTVCLYNETNVTRALSYAVNFNRLSVIDYLVKKMKADVNTVLVEAIKVNKSQLIKYLLNLDADVNAVGEGGMTPLGAAAERGLLGIVKSLCENGADVNKCDLHGKTPLTYAAKYNNDVIKYLLRKGADVDKVETGGQTPLAVAASEPPMGIYGSSLELLTANKANLNPIIGDNPLLIASKNRNEDFVRHLVEKGANVNKTDINGNSALLYSVKYKDYPLTEFLLNNGAHYSVHSVFFEAISTHNVQFIQLLLQKGADVNMKCKSGDTPLINTLKNNQLEIAEFLLEYGASVNIPDRKGNLPLAIFLQTHCIQMKHSQLIKIFIQKGKSSNAMTFCKCGCSFLTKFIQMDDCKMTSFLVENYADVNQKDNNGNLPLMIAALNKNYLILNILFQHGADIQPVRKKFEELAENDLSFNHYLKTLSENEDNSCKSTYRTRLSSNAIFFQNLLRTTKNNNKIPLQEKETFSVTSLFFDNNVIKSKTKINP